MNTSTTRARQVSDKAIVSPTAEIGEGVTIEAGCIIADGAVIGNGVVISRNAIVGDRCMIGESAVIGQGANISLTSQVGKYTHIGEGSTLVQCDIGGSVVIPPRTSIEFSAIDGYTSIQPWDNEQGVKIGYCRIGAHNTIRANVLENVSSGRRVSLEAREFEACRFEGFSQINVETGIVQGMVAGSRTRVEVSSCLVPSVIGCDVIVTHDLIDPPGGEGYVEIPDGGRYGK